MDSSVDPPPASDSRIRRIVDADDYIFASLDKEIDELLETMSIEEEVAIRTTQNYIRMAHCYCFQIQSGLHVISEDPFAPSVAERREETRKAAMVEGQRLAIASARRGQVFEPFWLKVLDRQIMAHPDPGVRTAAASARREVLQTTSVFFCASGTPEGPVIRICAMLKAILKHLNSPIAASRWEACNHTEENPADHLPYMEMTLKCLSIFGWFCVAEFRAGLLPYSIYLDERVYREASRMAHIQTCFMMLHELAHIALGHLRDEPGVNPNWFSPSDDHLAVSGQKVHITPSLRREIEADKWAFTALLSMDLGTALDRDLKLLSVGVLLGYLKTFEALASAHFDIPSARFEGIGLPIEAAVREYYFLRDNGESWTHQGERAAFGLYKSVLDISPGWLEATQLEDLAKILSGRA